ncbi:hypothetical protein KKI24_27195 [bacterium]|nr:hypothetical protein [bacterium]
MMAKLIDLNQYRMTQICDRAFKGWRKRFGGSYTPGTRFSDLDSATIRILAEPGENSAFIFYELIMGILNLGQGYQFDTLRPEARLKVVDIHFFLADLVRYELMTRIAWIETYTGSDQPLIELVSAYDASDYTRFTDPPPLSAKHPLYSVFSQKINREKDVMIRQLFRDALTVFKTTYNLP